MKIYVAKLDDDDSIEIFPNAIKDIDPNDIVHVVRCKDCKHWERDADFKDGWCRGERQYEDDFCSRGERRGEDGSD